MAINRDAVKRKLLEDLDSGKHGSPEHVLGRAGGGKVEGTSLVQGEGHSHPGNPLHLTKNILPLLSLQGPAKVTTWPQERSRPRSSVHRRHSGTGHLPPEYLGGSEDPESPKPAYSTPQGGGRQRVCAE